MSRRSAWILGAGVGAVALGGAIYFIWKLAEEEDDEKSGIDSGRLGSFTQSYIHIFVKLVSYKVLWRLIRNKKKQLFSLRKLPCDCEVRGHCMCKEDAGHP
jgi:hypothetical protein